MHKKYKTKQNLAVENFIRTKSEPGFLESYTANILHFFGINQVLSYRIKKPIVGHGDVTAPNGEIMWKTDIKGKRLGFQKDPQ